MRVDERRLREIQDLVGHKWDLRVLLSLHDGGKRYMELVNELRTGVEPISEKVLTDTLRRLRACGLVRHVARGDRQLVYAQTERGRHVARTIACLVSDDDCSDLGHQS